MAIIPIMAQSSEPFVICKIRCWNQVGGSAVQPGWGATTPQGVGPNKWQIEYRIKNQSDKPISVIHWSFQFVNRDKKNVVEDFKSKRSLKPTKESTVTETFEYDSRLMPQDLEGNILLRRIEYEDGSNWQPDPKKSESMLTEAPRN
jgi:hypothetical protein